MMTESGGKWDAESSVEENFKVALVNGYVPQEKEVIFQQVHFNFVFFPESHQIFFDGQGMLVPSNIKFEPLHITTQEMAECEIERLIEMAGGNYHDELSCGLNLMMAIQNLKFPTAFPIVFQNITFDQLYEKGKFQKVDEHFYRQGNMVFPQDNLLFDGCTFKSKDRIEIINNRGEFLLKGHMSVRAKWEVKVHLNGKRTSAIVSGRSLANVNKAGARGIANDRGIVHLNVAGAIGCQSIQRPRQFTIREMVNGGIFEKQVDWFKYEPLDKKTPGVITYQQLQKEKKQEADFPLNKHQIEHGASIKEVEAGKKAMTAAADNGCQLSKEYLQSPEYLYFYKNKLPHWRMPRASRAIGTSKTDEKQ